MAKKDRKASEILNVELAGIESAFTVALSCLKDDHPAAAILRSAKERCEAARDALLTIQFHIAQI